MTNLTTLSRIDARPYRLARADRLGDQLAGLELHLLASDSAEVTLYGNACIDPLTHFALLRQVQQLRGLSYRSRGLLSADDCDPDGALPWVIDASALHVLVMMENRLEGFMMLRPLTLDRLADSPLLATAARGGCRPLLQVELERELAAKQRLYEVGNWCVHPESNSHRAAIAVVMAGIGHALRMEVDAAYCPVGAIGLTLLRRFGATPWKIDDAWPVWQDTFFGHRMRPLVFSRAEMDTQVKESAVAIMPHSVCIRNQD